MVAGESIDTKLQQLIKQVPIVQYNTKKRQKLHIEIKYLLDLKHGRSRKIRR